VARRSAATGRPTVETAAGSLSGVRDPGGVTFRGIPYARAERFAPPAPAEPWTGVREAAQTGLAAPQPDRPVARFTHGPMPLTGEDCLNLNVYAPSLEGDRPVMVWLHGGGFVMGHAGASLYHGARLAAVGDIVVVTVNYRLGSLGWLCHRALGGGNWGLRDQIAALEWVRENIASFGGDPGRVTVAGQSAGALCAVDLLAAPSARGLFARAIVQSPPLGDAIQPADVAERWADALAHPPGLRSLAPERIVARHEELLEHPQWRGTRGGALPTLDPGSLPVSPLDEPGVSPEVDVLIGHTADEGTFFFDAPWRPAPPAPRVPDIVAHLCPGQDPHEVLDRYYERSGERSDDVALLVAIATDAIVVTPTTRWAIARAAAGARVYRYRVDHPGAGPQLRATHTTEVPLLFGTWDDGGPGERLGGMAPGAERVAAELVPAWVEFVRSGSPGWEGDPGVFGGTLTNA